MSDSHKISQFNSVKIQELEPVPENQYKDKKKYVADVKKKWTMCKCNEHVWDESKKKPCACSILYETQNGVINGVKVSGNAFLDAVLNAYNRHEDLVLSPDDIWMLVCLQFSAHVAGHAEQLRDKFVNHTGQKELVVTTHKETDESDWGDFLLLVQNAIKSNTKDNIVNTLECKFSTTGDVERMLSTLAVMSTFKKFFSYARCIPCCGIGNVHFQGTIDDWTSLHEKILSLKQYAVNQDAKYCKWMRYVENLAPVIRKLVDTYSGTPDVDWWNKIVNYRYGRVGSGSTSYISGWVLAFFNIHREVETDCIPALHFEVPVTMNNHLTGEKKIVQLIGGFYGVESVNKTHRPVMSMIVYHDGSLIKN